MDPVLLLPPAPSSPLLSSDHVSSVSLPLPLPLPLPLSLCVSVALPLCLSACLNVSLSLSLCLNVYRFVSVSIWPSLSPLPSSHGRPSSSTAYAAGMQDARIPIPDERPAHNKIAVHPDVRRGIAPSTLQDSAKLLPREPEQKGEKTQAYMQKSSGRALELL